MNGNKFEELRPRFNDFQNNTYGYLYRDEKSPQLTFAGMLIYPHYYTVDFDSESNQAISAHFEDAYTTWSRFLRKPLDIECVQLKKIK
jgi:hypothetical protein